MPLRILRLTGGNGFHDQFVMAHDVLRLAGRGQMQAAQPVDMAAAAFHQRPQFLLVGRRIQALVKVIVGGHEFLEVAGLSELLLSENDALSDALLTIVSTDEVAAATAIKNEFDADFQSAIALFAT